MKRKRIVVALVALGVFVALVLSVSDADAGIPRRTANCNATWKMFFRGNVLVADGQIRCTRPMKLLSGHASLVRMRLDSSEQLGAPSPQASAHDDFNRVQVAYYPFQVSHVCQLTDVSYMWWFTIQTRAVHRAGSKPQVKHLFSHTVITDCG